MKTHYKTMAVFALIALLNACSAAGGSAFEPGYGIVVRYEGASGITEKFGVLATSETGRRLFSPGSMVANGGGTSSYGGDGIPKWVRVIWRESIRGSSLADSGRMVETLDFGAVVGDYKLEIASRIPDEVKRYASAAPGRAIRLTFRVKDDGVLLAWGVQESYGQIWVESLRGGDFPCDPINPSFGAVPNCTQGPLKNAPWYWPRQ